MEGGRGVENPSLLHHILLVCKEKRFHFNIDFICKYVCMIVCMCLGITNKDCTL